MTLNGAIKQLHDLRNSDAMPIYFKPAIAEVINVLLSDVRENVRGEWLSGDCMGASCSNCGEYFSFRCFSEVHDYNFCPNCGAKMER